MSSSGVLRDLHCVQCRGGAPRRGWRRTERGLVRLRHCPACSSVLCPVPVGQTPSLCCPAVVCPLPRGCSWATLLSQPPGGTRYHYGKALVWIVEPRDIPAAGTWGWPCVPEGWTRALPVCGSRDVEAAPSHGSGEGKLFPAQPFLGVTPWEQPRGTNPAPGRLWDPCTLPAPNPTLSPSCCLLVVLLVPTSLLPSTLTPGWGAPALPLLGSSGKKSCSPAGMALK